MNQTTENLATEQPLARCILCLEMKRHFPPEHVFPEALGGSFEIARVCAECNHWLGSNVDAPLTDHLLIQLRRRELDIRGKNGRLPRPRLVGDVDDIPGVKVFLEYGDDEQMNMRIHPRVLVSKGDDGAVDKQIVAGDSELEEVAPLVNKIRRRAGKRPLERDEISREYPPSTFPQPRVTFTPEVDLHDYRRGVIKIVYELAHHWLGDEYLQDPLSATLREAICDSSFSPEDFQVGKLRGQILIGADLLPAFPVESRASHLAYTQRTASQIAMCVSVFDIFQACLIVSDDPDRYAWRDDMAILVDVREHGFVEGTLASVLSSAFDKSMKARSEEPEGQDGVE